MLKKRIIPVLLLRNGLLVQSKGFKRYQNLGSPTAAVQRLSSWASDELIYIDISPSAFYDLKRDDLKHEAFSSILDIITQLSKRCFMPLTFGGRIRTTEDIRARLQAGADKVTLNTIALEDISFIEKSAKQFGSQCIVISVDAKRHGNTWKVYKGGIEETALHPMEWAKSVENAGAGEILLNSIDMDGSGKGYDIELLMEISENVRLPVIALGGVGKWEHFAEALMRSKISAVAAANIFHYSENSVFEAKKYLFQAGFNVRKPSALSKVSRNL